MKHKNIIKLRALRPTFVYIFYFYIFRLKKKQNQKNVMPDLRPRCGTWHGPDRFRIRDRDDRGDRTTDQFFTMRGGARQCADIQLYDEVIIQALQDHDWLKITDM